MIRRLTIMLAALTMAFAGQSALADDTQCPGYVVKNNNLVHTITFRVWLFGPCADNGSWSKWQTIIPGDCWTGPTLPGSMSGCCWGEIEIQNTAQQYWSFSFATQTFALDGGLTGVNLDASFCSIEFY